MAKGDYRYIVTFDTKKGKAAIREFDDKVDKLGKTTKTAAGGFKNLAAKVAVGVAAFYAASKALKGVIRSMGDAVDKAAIQELAEKEVAAALESTGREVAKNTEHFKEYASQLQSATVFGDEQILSAQALMIQLTKLDREGLDAATKGAIGLASVYKTDLQAATTLVGKALAGNYGALSRYGIMVKRTATDEEKRASILEQLQTMYKRAEAETDTYQGAVKQLSNVYGDLKEEVGKVVTENEEFRDILKLVTEAIGELIESGAVEWFTDMATQATRSAPMLDSLATSLGLLALVFKMQAEKQGRASESMQEWFKYLQLNDELQQKLRKDIAEVIVVTEDQAEAIKETTKQIDTQLIAIRGIRTGMTAWGPEILTITEFINGLQDAFFELGETALPVARDVSDALGLAVSSFKGAAVKTGKYLEDLSLDAQTTYKSIAMSAAEGFAAILSTLRQWAIAEAVKYIFAKVPFPASLVIAALAAGAIGAFFNTIKSMETGGTIAREGIYHLHAGETVTPASNRVSNVYNQTGGARAVFNINITTTRAVNEEQLFKDIQREAHRHGYKL